MLYIEKTLNLIEIYTSSIVISLGIILNFEPIAS